MADDTFTVPIAAVVALAQAVRAYYEALRKTGFTHRQAFKLTTAWQTAIQQGGTKDES